VAAAVTWLCDFIGRGTTYTYFTMHVILLWIFADFTTRGCCTRVAYSYELYTYTSLEYNILYNPFEYEWFPNIRFRHGKKYSLIYLHFHTVIRIGITTTMAPPFYTCTGVSETRSGDITFFFLNTTLSTEDFPSRTYIDWLIIYFY